MGANIALNTEGCDFERIFPGVSYLIQNKMCFGGVKVVTAALFLTVPNLIQTQLYIYLLHLCTRWFFFRVGVTSFERYVECNIFSSNIP